MAFELAFVLEDGGQGMAEFMSEYGVSEEDLHRLCVSPQFSAMVERHREEIRRDGITFRMKSRIHAERCLPTMQKLVDDVTTPAAVRAKLFSEFVRFGGLDPGSGGSGDGGPGNGVSVTINMGEVVKRVASEAEGAIELPGESVGASRFVPSIPQND